MARPSNGPAARVGLELFCLSSREKPGEYCVRGREFKYMDREPPRSFARIKSKSEVSQVFARGVGGGQIRTGQNFHKQSKRAAFTEALREFAFARVEMLPMSPGIIRAKSLRRQADAEWRPVLNPVCNFAHEKFAGCRSLIQPGRGITR